jgi:hypothetical protein
VIGEGDAGAERRRGADDAVAAVELLLHGEHVHGAALPLGVAVAAAGQLGHDVFRVHAAAQHVAVIAIGGDHLVAVLDHRAHAGDDGFLAYIEMAEPADMAHAVELTRLLLEAADQQHGAIGVEIRSVALAADHLVGDLGGEAVPCAVAVGA